jgi:hypothetical protein
MNPIDKVVSDALAEFDAKPGEGFIYGASHL